VTGARPALLLPALLLTIAVTGGGCSALTPFATAPMAAKAGVVDAGPRVAICYNTLKTSAAQVQELGQAECLDEATAELIDTDYRLDACPLSTPARATFVCRPKKK
jgi:hypothetical protein